MPSACVRRWIDPETGDYVVESGRPRADTTLASAVLLRLRMRRGSCPLLPTLGSRLYLIRKNTESALRLAKHYAFEALDDLIRDERITNVAVETEAISIDGGAALGVTVSFTDGAGDQRTVQYQRRLGA